MDLLLCGTSGEKWDVKSKFAVDLVLGSSGRNVCSKLSHNVRDEPV